MITSSGVFRMLSVIKDCVDKAGKGEMRHVLFLEAAEQHGLIISMREATNGTTHAHPPAEIEVDPTLFEE